MRLLMMAITMFLLAGCSGDDPHASAGAFPSTTKEGPPRALWMASGTLHPLHEDQVGNGFVNATYFDNRQLAVEIRANLVPLEKGHYTAWLLDGASPTISAGQLTSPRGNGIHILRAEQNVPGLQPYKDYRRVAITREPSGSSTPDVVVEGLLTVVKTTQ